MDGVMWGEWWYLNCVSPATVEEVVGSVFKILLLCEDSSTIFCAKAEIDETGILLFGKPYIFNKAHTAYCVAS